MSCGSIFRAHVSDPGFSSLRSFSNLSVVEAIESRTSYTTALSILGVGGVLIENAMIG